MDLVLIDPKKYNIELDIKYATRNNVAKKAVYKNPLLYLHKDTIDPFEKALRKANSLGYTFKVFDGFRPFEAQKLFYELESVLFSDPNLAFKEDKNNPSKGLVPHCRGIAVDLTLIDKYTGAELDMGGYFDEDGENGHIYSSLITEKQQDNRLLLVKIMEDSGWLSLEREWWHFYLPNPRNYKVYYDVGLEKSMLK